ncbi:hypothetical protein B296_00031170 [Ensete ventricosum]|uniref:Uncharacterized protein n=1 Tax=Ensete ventricosum TaxID=4639 RepID=A0A427AH44_ENSVE|nr:hypothetical protein B296_00031170 [Ensete ventricosum]
MSQLFGVNYTNLLPKVNVFESGQYVPVRLLSADRYVNCPLPSSTTDWGCFHPVTTRNRAVTVNFDRRRSISSGINRGRKKKREKKRENLEIRHCVPIPIRRP